jgi:hypothetical protein
MGEKDSPDATQHNDSGHISSMERHSHFNRKKIYVIAQDRIQRHKTNRSGALCMAKKTQLTENFRGTSRIFQVLSHISPEV